MTNNEELKKKTDLIIKIVLIVIIILLLIHNCKLMRGKNQNNVPNGNVDIIDIKCDDNKCKPTPTLEPTETDAPKQKIESVSFSQSNVSIKKDATLKLITVIKPSSLSSSKLTWKSSDPSIVSVDANGNIKGLKEGTATITVTSSNGKIAKCVVKVTAESVKVEKITLNSNSMNIKVGDVNQIIASIEPENATERELVWSTSDSSVLTVDSNGVIKGLKPGKATVTVKTKDGKVVATCVVNIEAVDVKEIKLSSDKLSLKVGSSSQIKADIEPSNATNKEITWTTSDANVVTVDSNGKVTGLKPGTATITVKTKDGKVVATSVVTVEAIPVEEIKLNPSKMSLTVGTSSQIVSVVKPDDATDKELAWTTSDSSIVTVDSTGKVTGVGVGTATITAKTKDGKVVATCEVSIVTEVVNVEEIVLNSNNISLEKGSSTQLIATIKPENATERELVWTTSDSSVATVDSTGKVTGNGLGTTTITVKTKDGKVVATCVVNVEPVPVENIVLNKTETTINVGDSETLTATVEPENATDKELIWTTSDSSIATVDSNGKVTGVKKGTVTITAKIKDGTVKAECVVTVEIELVPNNVNVYDDDKPPVNWNGSNDLKIFSKSIYDFDDVIAPESYNTYKFIVRNNTEYKIKYNIKFVESNTYEINMKYKLKKNDAYIISEYTKATNLIVDEYTLNPNEVDTYYLDWKWLSSSNDTNIGTNPEAKYGLRIEVEAESINE